MAERTEANLRWASNALTTNGEMHGRTLTVIATAEVDGGTAAGTVSQEIAGPDEVAAVVAAAERRPGPAGRPRTPRRWSRTAPPATTGPPSRRRPTSRCWPTWPGGSGEAFARGGRPTGQLLFGFAEHIVTTTYLGSTTGLRRRGVQPTGRLELNAKTARRLGVRLGRPGQPDFTDVDVAALDAEAGTRLGWASGGSSCRRGAYETMLPPGPVADLLIYAYWTANARDAEEGRNVFAARERRHPDRRDARPTLPLHPVVRPGAIRGWRRVPFVADVYGADGTSWTFDGGLPIDRDDLDRPAGCSRELIRNRARRRRPGWRRRRRRTT